MRQIGDADRAAHGKPWVRLAPLVLSMAMEALEVGLLPVMFPTMEQRIGLVATDLGVLTAANRLAGAVFGPLWLWLTRRWTRKAVLVASAVLAGLVAMGRGEADGLPALLLLSCLLAAVCAGTAPLTTAILADLVADGQRGRAVGLMYASIAVLTGLLGAALGQLSRFEQGWRLGYLVLGGMGLVAALLIVVWFDDLGPQAPDEAGLTPEPGRERPGLRAAMAVFGVPSFRIMLVSRLLSGHLVIGSFGIVFLTGVRHFPNATAALVLLPFGIGSCLGNLGGAVAADWLHARAPASGRIIFLQTTQLAFAFVAYWATQVPWDGIGPYLWFWTALGLLQGVNPGVNRPIVISVIRPELRSWAFMFMLAMVEPAAWAALNFGVSMIAEREGLQMALLAVLVGMMALNGLAVTPLYWTYRPDSVRTRLPAEARRSGLVA